MIFKYLIFYDTFFEAMPIKKFNFQVNSLNLLRVVVD